MPEIVLGLGSNLHPDRHLPAAVAELEASLGPLRCSSVYESPAVGFAGAPFQNLVVAGGTALLPLDLKALLAATESRHGRVREGEGRFAVPLDIDLLLYGDLILHRDGLRLPRPDITERAFVLEPLAELLPKHRHPESGVAYGELWARFDKSGLGQRRMGRLAAAADPGGAARQG